MLLIIILKNKILKEDKSVFFMIKTYLASKPVQIKVQKIYILNNKLALLNQLKI